MNEISFSRFLVVKNICSFRVHIEINNAEACYAIAACALCTVHILTKFFFVSPFIAMYADVQRQFPIISAGFGCISETKKRVNDMRWNALCQNWFQSVSMKGLWRNCTTYSCNIFIVHRAQPSAFIISFFLHTLAVSSFDIFFLCFFHLFHGCTFAAMPNKELKHFILNFLVLFPLVFIALIPRFLSFFSIKFVLQIFFLNFQLQFNQH